MIATTIKVRMQHTRPTTRIPIQSLLDVTVVSDPPVVWVGTSNAPAVGMGIGVAAISTPETGT
jgi:hypothetical protein